MMLMPTPRVTCRKYGSIRADARDTSRLAMTAAATMIWARENISDFFHLQFAQQSRWSEQQDQDQNGKRDGVAVGGPAGPRDERLHHSDDHAAEGRAGNVSD